MYRALAILVVGAITAATAALIAAIALVSRQEPTDTSRLSDLD